MWRDARSKIIQCYMTLFPGSEKEGFSIVNECHLFTLKYIFMNSIQENLDDFKSILK